MNNRWHKFKQNRLGYCSFWFIIILFSLSLLSPVICNDRPLVIKNKGHYYFPIFQNVSENMLGGDPILKAEANFKDSHIQKLIAENGWSLNALVPFRWNTISFDEEQLPSHPNGTHLLGTDSRGRDVLALLFYGSRTSLLMGLALTVCSSIIGILVGALQGFLGGRVDLWGQRIIEIWSGMPILYLLIIFSSLMSPSFFSIFLILMLFSWMSLVGVVRAEFLKARNYEFILAARALGLSNFRIMIKHVLPNAFTAALTFLPFIMTGSITTLASLDYLGLGLVGHPSLGDLLRQGYLNLFVPSLAWSGLIYLSLLLSAFIFTGEALRDAYDPHIRHQS